MCVWVPLWCQAASQCNSRQSGHSCVGMGVSVRSARPHHSVLVSKEVAVVCVWVPLWCQAASQYDG